MPDIKEIERIHINLIEAGYSIRSGTAAHLFYVTDGQGRTFTLRIKEGEWICFPVTCSDQDAADRILETALRSYTPQIDPVILNILSIYVFAAEFLASTLAEMGQNATAEDWLTLAYANGTSRARDSTTSELENVLERAIQAAGGTGGTSEATT